MGKAPPTFNSKSLNLWAREATLGCRAFQMHRLKKNRLLTTTIFKSTLIPWVLCATHQQPFLKVLWYLGYFVLLISEGNTATNTYENIPQKHIPQAICCCCCVWHEQILGRSNQIGWTNVRQCLLRFSGKRFYFWVSQCSVPGKSCTFTSSSGRGSETPGAMSTLAETHLLIQKYGAMLRRTPA